jgi:hypothetical protein
LPRIPPSGCALVPRPPEAARALLQFGGPMERGKVGVEHLAENQSRGSDHPRMNLFAGSQNLRRRLLDKKMGAMPVQKLSAPGHPPLYIVCGDPFCDLSGFWQRSSGGSIESGCVAHA